MYFTPYIDATGVHLPSYEDRLEALVSSYRAIFGQDINLEISSPDYQLLSVFARALDDLSQLILDDFASRNPQYASGAALDLLMPLHGLSRSGATFSTALVKLTGYPGAVLPTPPEALDEAGYLWRCQVSGITLGEDGTTSVLAVCTTPGAIPAPTGWIHRLVSPVAGLTSMVNTAAATPGVEAETDASCRNRLALAAAAPSVSTLEALRSAVLSVTGVTACAIYENSSDETDSNGIPAHSICVVVVGGSNANLGPVIFGKKAPGIGTYGSRSTTVTDAFGDSHTVCLERATSVPVSISITLTALPGYASSTADSIRTALTAYGNTLTIGQDLVVPSLYGICYGVDSSSAPTFSITSLSASANGVRTTEVLSAGWKDRFSILSYMIEITVNN